MAAHILSEPIVRTLFKRKQAQDTEYTHFISKEGHSQSNVSENTVKILLMLSEYFSEQLKIHTMLTKLLGILGTQLRNCGSFQQRISG